MGMKNFIAYRGCSGKNNVMQIVVVSEKVMQFVAVQERRKYN
jgi:hypothetical protein